VKTPGYSAWMGKGPLAAVLAAAAVLGGAVALVLADAVGRGDDPATETVVVSAPFVQPSVETAPRVPPLLGNGFDPAAIYAARARGVVTIYADFSGTGSQGSGFVVDDEGTILTNAHVITNVGGSSAVRGADRVYVEFRDGERLPAAIVGYDLFADVGVIRVETGAHRLEPLPLGDSASVVVGTPVAAIGTPFGNQSSLAVGVVAATGRSIPSITSEYSVADAIQTDAPINRGNSGGPLLDPRGRVIGINAQIRSNSGNAEGVGFAIPINAARRSLTQLVATGRVAYAYIGITSQDVTPGIARRFELGAQRGALVIDVKPGTPAASAGLRGGSRNTDYNGLPVTLGGDVIVRIGRTRIRGSEDVSRVVTEELAPGQTVRVTFVRAGQRRVVALTLTERPPGSTG
jgi:S1-C subfamily serine protease